MISGMVGCLKGEWVGRKYDTFVGCYNGGWVGKSLNGGWIGKMFE